VSKYLSYQKAGVDLDASDEMVRQIQASVLGTYGPRVVQIEEGFAGMFRLDYDEKLFKKNYKNPVLVACTDGVGSKVQLAAGIKKFDTIGIDLVAMNVNDMLVYGAEPLFFLDYLAVHKLEPGLVAEMVKGIAVGCKLADCALIGGETAEMPDTYKAGDLDMAGFAVGVVERKKIIQGSKIRQGDCILGLASNGLHSNGFALVRRICFKAAGLKMTDRVKELDGMVLADELLKPTRIYVRSIIKLLSGYRIKSIVHGMAHITGGGLAGNIPRILPKDCDAVIDKSTWPRPKIFTFLQKKGPVQEEEMFGVFNMGIGFVLVVAKDFAESIAKKLTRYGERVYKIGRITSGTGKAVLK